jgi:hypothetical protein
VPVGVAAVAVAPASTGDAAVFALSLAVIRLVLAAGYIAGRDRDELKESGVLGRRITQACLVSAALFAISAAVLRADPVRALGGGHRRRVERRA